MLKVPHHIHNFNLISGMGQYTTSQGRRQDFRRGGGAEGGGGVPRSAKEANNPNKRAAELKPRPCTHQGLMFRP